MTKISELHRRWSKDRDYKDAYDALGEEFDLARALIEARTAAGLSQSQLARRMKTSLKRAQKQGGLPALASATPARNLPCLPFRAGDSPVMRAGGISK